MSTLKEIAADLGVHHTLVSRVLSGKMGNARVGQAKREAILQRAREVDYQPNRLALALKHGKKGVIGLFLHTIGTRGSELNERFLHAASDILGGMGLRLWLRFFERDEEFLAACAGNLRREVDGLILAGISHDELMGQLAGIEASGVPVVCAFHNLKPQRKIINIQVDHAHQGYLATQHLLECGCRRIAHFHQNESRGRGYLRALREAGLPKNAALIVPARRFTYADGVDCTARLLAAGTQFDGIVAGSDPQAAGAINHLLCQGIRRADLPRITGVDDSPVAQQCVVPLTSVTAEMETTARLAVEAIIQKMAGQTARSMLIPASLVVRDSTVAPKG